MRNLVAVFLLANLIVAGSLDAAEIQPGNLARFITWTAARGGVESATVSRDVLRVRAGRKLMNADLDTKRTTAKAYFDMEVTKTPALATVLLIDSATGVVVVRYSAATGFQ